MDLWRVLKLNGVKRQCVLCNSRKVSPRHDCFASHDRESNVSTLIVEIVGQHPRHETG